MKKDEKTGISISTSIPKDPSLPRFSASQTKKAEECLAAWWYSRLKRSETTPAQAFGTEAHAHLEGFIRDRVWPCEETALTDGGKNLLSVERVKWASTVAKAAAPAFPHTDVFPEWEFWLTLCLDGKPLFQFLGFIDAAWVGEHAAIAYDLKTTSNFGYAMTEEQLMVDTAAILYAAAMLCQYDREKIGLTWVYAHSKNKKKIAGPIVKGTMDSRHIFDGLAKLVPLWQTMAKAKDKQYPPKGNAPGACWAWHRGCDYLPENGGSCVQVRKVDVFDLLMTRG